MSPPKAEAQIPLADLAKLVRRNPWAIAVLVLCGGGGIGGGAAMFGLATKADVQELKQQVSEIKVTVDKLAIQAGVEEQIRLRSLQARSVATNAGHDRGP